ncbi:MAG TPA: hypothetical protein PKC18_06295, partial [Lacipirellulaceae bacterium]|nr:hypothetical protein [Lacipirellulaceae bacterium]
MAAKPGRAATPSEHLLSSATRGFAAAPHLDTLLERWNESQFGQLAQDEAMQPFIKDMRAQIERKLSGARQKLGLQPDDLRSVATGEVAFGLVERENDRAAVAIVVDASGRAGEVQALLAKIDADLTQRGAKRSTAAAGAISMTVYAIPPQGPKDIARQAVFFTHDDMLCACDNLDEAREMAGRFGGQPGQRLADVAAYREVMQQVAAEAGDLRPEIRWFVDPFGYARASRSLLPADSALRRGTDYVSIFEGQGFDAIQGAGGYVNLAVEGTFELLHRTAVHAPQPAGGYRLAMNMLQFPNGSDLNAQAWIPRKLASYRTFNIDIQNAFDHFGSLFDAIVGYEDAFAEAIKGLETDPYGPHVKVRDEVIAHLGRRVTLVTDYDVPITTKSERFLFAVEAQNEAAVAAAIEKILAADPNAHARQVAGKKVWEILPATDDVPELEIPLEPLTPAEGDGGKREGMISNSAVCVTDGHLFVASHLDFLQSFLAGKAQGEALAGSHDYVEVDAALDQLLRGAAAVRCFVRTDEAYRPTYELLRQGKMPESETLLGRVLNRVLTTPEDEDEGVLRQQQIDGRELPNFEMVRRYFSPLGTAVRTTETGWFIVGASLTKRAVQVQSDRPGPA